MIQGSELTGVLEHARDYRYLLHYLSLSWRRPKTVIHLRSNLNTTPIGQMVTEVSVKLILFLKFSVSLNLHTLFVSCISTSNPQFSPLPSGLLAPMGHLSLH